MVQADSATIELANDHVMWLGEDMLALWEQLSQLASTKFWTKEISISDGLRRKAHRYVMKVVWCSFPHLHLVVHKKVGTINFNLYKDLRA